MKDWISIYNAKHKRRQKEVIGFGDFYLYPLIVKVFHDKIEFSHPTLDYNKITISPHKRDDWKDAYIFHITGEDIMPGRYYIDEDESNEDIKIIYFDTKH